MKPIERFSCEEKNLATIHPLLADIVYNRHVYLPNGEIQPLKAEVSRQEMYFIYSQILGMESCQKVLEIGFAMGVSSLVIGAALSARGGGQHLILDPFEETYWKNIGVEHLRRAGFTNWKLFASGSEFVLPKMLEQGEQFDFIFQDGMHTFDHCLLEFHYLDRMLKIGGLLLYDDVDCYHLNRLIRYISLYPHWEIVACAGTPYESRGRKGLNVIRRAISPLLRVFPREWAIEFFSDALLRPDHQLGLDSSMIALRKIGADPRTTDYRTKF